MSSCFCHFPTRLSMVVDLGKIDPFGLSAGKCKLTEVKAAVQFCISIASSFRAAASFIFPFTL